MLRKRPFVFIVGLIAAVLIFAYGFQVTQVNLEELGSETRQQSLARIMRALARPDFQHVSLHVVGQLLSHVVLPVVRLAEQLELAALVVQPVAWNHARSSAM